MKKIALLFFIIMLSAYVSAQKFTEIDEIAKNAPASASSDIESLGKYLTKQANSDIKKVRAFYVWITHNIEYDINAFLNKKLEINNSTEKFLKRKKGVCQDYANLFKALCDYADINCMVISGYSKGFGFNPGKTFGVPDHSWNAIKINNEWKLVDATWGSGFVDERTKFVRSFTERFFLSEPEKFIYTHLSIDPMWQLLDCPISIKDFTKDSTEIKQIIDHSEKCFDFRDSIEAFQNLPEEEKALKTAKNSYRFNPDNTLNIGLAYLNYGVSKSTRLVKKQNELKPEVILEGMQEVLGIYNISKQYLLHVKGENKKELLDICNKNIKNTQNNIKQLKDFINR